MSESNCVPTPDGPDVREVEAIVLQCVSIQSQVRIRAVDGTVLSITRRTDGVDWEDLKAGQRLRCTVTRKTPTVLTAELIE